MTQDEYRKRLIQALASATTKDQIRSVITEADQTLESSKIRGVEKRAFFDQFICEAQDNTATMQNAGEAQEIVNQLIGK